MHSVFQIIRQKSLRELLFRIGLIIRGKCGLLKWQFPTNPKLIDLPSLYDFRNKQEKYLFPDRESINIAKNPKPELEEIWNKIMHGNVQFFSKEWKPLGLDFDWVTNPITGFKYNSNQFWNSVESIDSKAGDIKYTWEKSRFSWLYHIIRYDYHFDKDSSEFVFDSIIDWINHNPINCGPNYKCSQEISLRVLNWIFALFFYKHSANLTEERWNKIIRSIYWQTRHVYSNINFSRIAVRNNHAITETLTLYLVGLLFPELPYANKWKKHGKMWFEQEIAYQFVDDGSYLQQSMNYQRVVVQLLTLGISLSERNAENFSEIAYINAYKSLNFLYQCQDETTGWLPNYGANDGALFFPLSIADYRDFRPQLDALHNVLTGCPLYGKPLEDSLWYGITIKMYPPLVKNKGLVNFTDGGYVLFKEEDTLTFVRCGTFKGISTPDQLHVDIWYKGENVLFDGGSYRYNCSEQEQKYFSGTESHNTIMIGNNDQMLKGPRFMWFYPAKIVSTDVYETKEYFELNAKVKMFRYLGESIIVNRKIRKKKNCPEWHIYDLVENHPNDMLLRQLWHILPESNVCFESTGKRIEKNGAYSSFYGIKEECLQIEFQTFQNKITTTITI